MAVTSGYYGAPSSKAENDWWLQTQASAQSPSGGAPGVQPLPPVGPVNQQPNQLTDAGKTVAKEIATDYLKQKAGLPNQGYADKIQGMFGESAPNATGGQADMFKGADWGAVSANNASSFYGPGGAYGGPTASNASMMGGPEGYGYVGTAGGGPGVGSYAGYTSGGAYGGSAAGNASMMGGPATSASAPASTSGMGNAGPIAAGVLASAIGQGYGDRAKEGGFMSRFQEGALPSPAKNLGLTEGSEFNAKEFGISTFLPFLNFFREPNTRGQEDGQVLLNDLGMSGGRSGNNRGGSGPGGSPIGDALGGMFGGGK